MVCMYIKTSILTIININDSNDEHDDDDDNNNNNLVK